MIFPPFYHGCKILFCTPAIERFFFYFSLHRTFWTSTGIHWRGRLLCDSCYSGYDSFTPVAHFFLDKNRKKTTVLALMCFLLTKCAICLLKLFFQKDYDYILWECYDRYFIVQAYLHEGQLSAILDYLSCRQDSNILHTAFSQQKAAYVILILSLALLGRTFQLGNSNSNDNFLTYTLFTWVFSHSKCLYT